MRIYIFIIFFSRNSSFSIIIAKYCQRISIIYFSLSRVFFLFINFLGIKYSKGKIITKNDENRKKKKTKQHTHTHAHIILEVSII
jgi:hypothetical protein